MSKLILLSLLNERDLYGYEIKHILKEKYSYFTKVSFSTIYYTLDKLEDEGFITKREEKVGNRPTRSIYHITPQGKKEFQMSLLKVLKKEGKRTSLMDPFNLPFSLMGKLPQEVLSDYDRIRILEGKKSAIGEVRGELKGVCARICEIPEHERGPEMDIYTCLLIKRGIAHMDAELSWIDEVIEEIRDRMTNGEPGNDN
jgi:DNA-binding PadR family transcriptional regulator